MAATTSIARELADATATEALGAALARVLRPPCTLYLDGDLGAGKTTFTRGLLRALGHAGSVKSPTYTLVEPYRLPWGTLYHLDLYRLSDPEELEFLGVRELAAADAVVVVEWPSRGAGFLPPPDLSLALDVHGDGRRACFTAHSARGNSLLTALDDTR